MTGMAKLGCKHEHWGCTGNSSSQWHSCSTPGCQFEWNSRSPYARVHQPHACVICGHGAEDRKEENVVQRKATDTQVGGYHYSQYKIQPIDYIVQNDLDWFQGNMIKYATRFKSKGKKQDLQKVIHYAQLAMEHYYPEEK